MNYQPKKPFFKMNIKELKEYVNECKRLDKVVKSKKNTKQERED